MLFRGGSRGAVATIEPLEGSSVPVLLWKIRPQDELSLDRYEGYPNFYRKEMLEVELNGKPVNGMVYIMNDGREFGAPQTFISTPLPRAMKPQALIQTFWIRPWRNPFGWHRSSRLRRMRSSAFGSRNGGDP